MPATPRYALPYPAAGDPADVPLDMQELADRIELAVAMPALSATPPATPVDGTLWALSPTVGVVWLFRYNPASGSTYKWELIGGPQLLVEVLTAETTASVSYVDLATVGPSVTAPRNGEYLIEFGFRGDRANVANSAAWGSPKLGAATAIDADAAVASYSSGVEVLSNSVSRRIYRTLSAADLVKLQHRANTANAVTIQSRFLGILPRRIS